MANRKYTYYTLVANYWQVDEQYENYREAFREYQKNVHYGHPSTLYGHTEQGDIEVIMSNPGKH